MLYWNRHDSRQRIQTENTADTSPSKFNTSFYISQKSPQNETKNISHDANILQLYTASKKDLYNKISNNLDPKNNKLNFYKIEPPIYILKKFAKKGEDINEIRKIFENSQGFKDDPAP